ncbi:RNA-guided pseudouridylation complex pseudouridine synthase subunit Cbf5 [Aeropyrum camini]|uniref:H/ACA RNA-protein complex component Cbf5p n=1 Tax=Aeropyrum camini SY1 = JCM 12091 TaxID=1198449 RepID=U3TDU9_9CREN|nr:RNA-guided pseudouridylation complex pseudouridine synthase subunit Cbf5 [Aeropyrum camini]BAN90123.1 H/ACA RNA-protein complex component Cbf5p [Aeropyrum camini SY1 = JCM 12091]
MALERMTRIIGTVMHSSKEYVCVMQLHRPVEEGRLREVLRLFEGEIYQKPPLRSSVKRALRTRRIFRIELLEYTGKYALLRVDCEAGTYMRKLCWDIGLVLGVGAHMRELRRVRTGPFSEDSGLMVRLDDVAYAVIRWREEGKDDLLRRVVIPGEYSVCHIPKVLVRDSAVESLTHGAQLAAPGVAAVEEGVEKGGMVALMTLKGELIGLGKALASAEEILQAERGIVVGPTRIIMERGLYPRMWKRQQTPQGA